MARYQQTDAVAAEVVKLRNQGLPDNLIAEELRNRGYNTDQINQSIYQADAPPEMPGMPAYPNYPAGGMPTMPLAPAPDEGNMYGRMEEIAENLIDEKWDELIAEVKKIIEWKEKVEERQLKLGSEVEKLKEDFKVLHQGVLGRLEEYDGRMRDVGTELKAVGKVFKDVIPEFVENVKELKSMTGKGKGKSL